MEKFFHRSSSINMTEIKSRIAATCSALGWQMAIAHILNRKAAFRDLKVAEIGCGTGTFSLTLNLLGAETTLVDADDDALNMARKAFALYNRNATFIKADVLEPVPASLAKNFDIVVSGGLAEHFVGSDREKCLYFHRELLCEGGFVYIGVPNKLSVFYQIVKTFRQITGTWKIKCEIPFTYWELRRYAKNMGFEKSMVVGNYTLRKDMIDYTLGLISAILDVLPSKIRQAIHSVRPQTISSNRNANINETNEQQAVLDMVKYVKENMPVNGEKSLKDFFGAGIILFGFLEQQL